MKKLLALSAALIAMTGVALTTKAQEADRTPRQNVGIAFYNLENLFDTIPNNPEGRDEEFTPKGSRQWNGEKYWSKIHNMARSIASFTSKGTPNGPAIIGVSEIENRSVLEDLVNDPQIKNWGLEIVHHDSPDARGVDVGMLYNPRYFHVENVTNHRLSEVPFRTRDQMCVVGSLMGQRIAVIVNHWPSRLGGEERSEPNRMAAARLCLAISDSLWKVDPRIGVIIMGDMNDDPQNRSCAEVLNAQKSPDNVEPHGFYNPFWEKLDKGIGTLAYKSSWNLFDQIIISGNLVFGPRQAWTFNRAEVLNRDFLKDTEGTRQGYPLRTYAAGSFLNGYSDHFPTEIFLHRVPPMRKK